MGMNVPDKNKRNHEVLGAEFLASMGFSKRVQEICKGHVKAKRYLCWKSEDYYNGLHPASKAKLEFQGGPMSDQEAADFEKDPLFNDILQMRKFDEQALAPERQVLQLEEYSDMIKTIIQDNLNKPIRPRDFGKKKVNSIDNLLLHASYDDGKKSTQSLFSGNGYQQLPTGPKIRPSKKPQYYKEEDLKRKRAFQDPSAKPKNFPNCCALEHDAKFNQKVAEGKKAMKKLFFVAFICFLFMGCEFAGGIYAGSLAILADAAHMFSDVAAFMISFFSIYIAQGEASIKYTMGYHRAEVLGSYVSIFLIWGLLVWLNWEATHRLINHLNGTEIIVIDANVMLITACIGFSCNVINICALNADCGGDDEEEEESEESESDEESFDVRSNFSKASVTSRSLHGSLMGVYKPKSAYACAKLQKVKHTIKEENEDSDDDIEEDKKSGIVRSRTPKVIAEENENANQRESLLKKHARTVVEEKKQVEKAEKKKAPKEKDAERAKRAQEEKNMNVRAAIIHIAGDMVQSIGVISAAVIIKVKPEWVIADPISTYLFSVLVLMTTVPIFIECTRIIMECAPDDVDTVALYNDILQLRTVEEVHDFHVWSLAGGKYVMTIHVRSGFTDKAIKDINRVAKNGYGIYHSTIQVEKEKHGANAISCDHNK